MKTRKVSLLLGFVLGFCILKLPAQVRIVEFDPDGRLAWSNPLCAPGSVYEVLQADSLGGPWRRLASVTNQTFLALNGLLPQDHTNLFLKVEWVEHESIQLDYSFTGVICEGSGLLDLRLVRRPAGTWLFVSDFCELEGHPEGQGQFLFPWSTFKTNQLVLYVGEFGFDNKTWLDGIIEPIEGAPCGRWRYTGTVYRETFGGTEPIGTFIAHTP